MDTATCTTRGRKTECEIVRNDETNQITVNGEEVAAKYVPHGTTLTDKGIIDAVNNHIKDHNRAVAGDTLLELIPAGKFRKALKSRKKKKRGRGEAPARDSTGRIHGKQIPNAQQIKKMSTEELHTARAELKASVGNRHRNQSRHRGNNPQSDKQHGERIAEEQTALNQIERELARRGEL